MYLWRKVYSTCFYSTILTPSPPIFKFLRTLPNVLNNDSYQFTFSPIVSVQFLSVAQSCLTLCDPMECHTPGLSVHHQLPELMSSELVMPSNHLNLCCPFLLPPSIFTNIRVFSKESILPIRWPKYWSFRFSISPSNAYSGLISFRVLGKDLNSLFLSSLNWFLQCARQAQLWARETLLNKTRGSLPSGSPQVPGKDGREASMLGISVWQGVQHCVGSARDTMWA